MPLDVRRVGAPDADRCVALLHSATADHLGPLGTISWRHPRVAAVVREDAEAGRLYGVWDGEALIATFAICEVPDDYFADIAWAEPAAGARYLHRIAVTPARQGSGLGTFCLRAAERYSAAAGATYLRLDTLAEDTRVVRFYRQHGYIERGVAWPESGEPAKPRIPLTCFEKRVAPAVHVRRATAGDAAHLAAAAAEMFVETYAAFNDPANLAAHVAARYNAERQLAEINDPAATVLLAFADDDPRIAGFAYFATGGDIPPAVADPDPMELKRFYVASAWHGRGIAQTLMRAVIEHTAARGVRTLWLGVWEHNPRAIAFYQKAGFTSTGTCTFCLGTELQDDLVMVRAVP